MVESEDGSSRISLNTSTNCDTPLTHCVAVLRYSVTPPVLMYRTSSNHRRIGMRTTLGVLVGTLLIAGCAGTTGTAAPASAPASAATVATPSPSGAFGGMAHFTMDGKPATTTVDLVVDGTSVSGPPVTDIGQAP